MNKEYTSEITLKFSVNNLEAKSKKEYINKLKENFLDDFNIVLDDSEITNINKG